MRMISFSAALVASLGALCATTLQQLSLDDMIRKSSEIVHGKVHCTGPAWRGSTLYTNYRVQIAEQWKGIPATQLDFAVLGGSINGIRQTYAGAPAMDDGQDLILFLWTSKNGLRQVIGLSQGLFNVTQDSTGQLFATRGATGETMLGAAGQPVRDSGLAIRLSDLRATVSNTLSGRPQ